MFRVAVNARSLGRRTTGVERYAREVTRRLDGRCRAIVPSRSLPGVAGHAWEQLVLPARLRGGELLWSPANTGPLLVSRQVLTLHDASFVSHPEWFDRKFALWYRLFVPVLLRRVAAVVTDSCFSMEQISRSFRIAPEKIRVVACGVDAGAFHRRSSEEQSAVRKKLDIEGDIVLTVGSLTRRKNLSRLFQAWRRGGFSSRGSALVVVGEAGKSFNGAGYRELPAGVRLISGLADDELAALYSAALVSIFPSLEEGFGLPLLESMACGTPVLAARAGAYPEVMGEAGVFFDPLDENSIEAGLCLLLEDPQRREALAAAGLERSSRFDWETTAGGVWEVLQHAAG